MPGSEHDAGLSVLVTAFDAFGGEYVNPSEQVLGQLPDNLVGAKITKVLLPTEFEGARRTLLKAIAEHRPGLVLSLGQAGGRAAVTVERVAINLADASIPDNAGNQPLDEEIVTGGPAAYFSTLPVKAMVHAMKASGVKTGLSHTAGTFVCNAVMYSALHELAVSKERYKNARAGFIHVPYVPEQLTGKSGDNVPPAMELEEIVLAVRLALETAITTDEDLAVAGGATH